MASCVLNNRTLPAFKLKSDEIARSDDRELKLRDFLSSLRDTYKLGTRGLKRAYETIKQSFQEVFGDKLPSYINESNIYRLINRKDIEDVNVITTEEVNNAEQVEYVKESLSWFMRDAYINNRLLRRYVTGLTNENLVDVLFLSRGSVDVDNQKERNSNYKGIGNNQALNRRIKTYKNILYGNIIRYLKSVDSSVEDLPDTIYDSKGNYNGAFDDTVLRAAITTHLIGSKHLNGILDSFRNRYYDDPYLLAYNANVILSHFDDYLNLNFPKIISIKKGTEGKEVSDNKYKLSDNYSQITTSFRVDSDIDVSKEVNAITKTIINTTRVVSWEDGSPVPGEYITFPEWSYFVAHIKQLALDANAYKKFNEIDRNLMDDYEDKGERNPKAFSHSTIQILESEGFEDLASIINALPSNPTDLFPVVFEILCNKEYYKHNTELYRAFSNKDLLNKLRSINEGIFNGSRSVRVLSDPNSKRNYYLFATQSANTINVNRLTQYTLDSDGRITPRLMNYNIVSLIANYSIRSRINELNSRKLIVNWDSEVKAPLQMNAVSEDPDDPIRSLRIEITIPDTKITAKISFNGQVELFKNGQEIAINNSFDLEDLSAVRNFIYKTLGVDLNHNSDLEELLNELTDGYCLNTLLRMSATTIYCKYLSNTYVRNSSNAREAIQTLNSLGLKSRIYLGDIDLVHPRYEYLLYSIATAKAILDGRTTSSVVLDASNNANSNYTFRRLLESFPDLWDLMRRTPNCPTNHFMLLNTGNFVKGIYNIKEFHGRLVRSKATKLMNVKELFTANFLYDYIGALTPFKDHDSYRIVLDGKALFTTSVNADKDIVGKILVDLKLVPIVLDEAALATDAGGLRKSLMDYTREELITLINSELGSYYTRLFDSINDDINKLANYLYSKDNVIGATLLNALLDDFKSFNNVVRERYGSPLEYIDNLIRDYNNNNKNKIELVDNVHFVTLKNGNLSANKVLLSQIGDFGRYTNLEESLKFWNSKERDLVKVLLDENFKLNLNSISQSTVSNDIQPELQYLRYLCGTDWVNRSGNMVICKIRYKNLTYKISSLFELRTLIRMNGGDDANWIEEFDRMEGFELNPYLSRYNLLDHLISLEFLDSTVGSYTSHPYKSETLAEMEIELQDAQNKRNASLTSPLNLYTLNSLNGLPETRRIAVIRDPKDVLCNFEGLESEIDPWDGGVIVDPFTSRLETISAGGNVGGVGNIKKPYIHSCNVNNGLVVAVKAAFFGLDNDEIRNSEFNQRLMKKMTDHRWRDINGNIIDDYDVSKKFVNYRMEYFEEDGKYYQILKNNKIGKNQYTNTILRVDEEGNPYMINDEVVPTETRVYNDVNTNYKLWLMFGGDRSMSLVNGVLEYSDVSIDNVVTAMNTKLEIIPGKEHFNSQLGRFLPLKHSDINYFSSDGAVKFGAANINPSARATDDVPLNYFTISMRNAGIILDKEHFIDDADIANATQASNSAVYRGFTFDLAMNLYRSLGELSNLNTEKHLRALKDLLLYPNEESFIDAFQDVMELTIAESFGRDSSNTTNFALSLLLGLQSRSKGRLNIPLSDSTIYNKAITSINSYFTLHGIKAKLPGVLAILRPSYLMMKIYDERKYGDFNKEKVIYEAGLKMPSLDSNRLYRVNGTIITNDVDTILSMLLKEEVNLIVDIKGTLAEALLKYDDNPVYDVNDPSTNIADIKMNRTYKIYFNDGTMQRLLVKAKEYMALRRRNDISKIVEDITVGRDLAPMDVKFYGTLNGERRKFSLYDLDSILAIFRLAEINEIEDAEEKYSKLKNLLTSFIILGLIGENSYTSVAEKEVNAILRSKGQSALLLWRLIKGNVIPPENLEEALEEEKRVFFLRENENLYKYLYKFVHKWKQFDYNRLSVSDLSLLHTYDKLILLRNELIKQGKDLTDWYKKYAFCMRTLFGLKNLTITDFDKLDKLFRSWIESTLKVRIHGNEYDVDETEKYAAECIIPKLHRVDFNLTNKASVADILNDEEYFVKLLLRNMGTKVDSKNYSVEFKVSSGNHYYVLDESQLTGDLVLISPYVITDNQRRFRCDSKGNYLYELDENAKIYLDKFGNEVIVTSKTGDNTGLGFYINNLNYNGIALSENITDDIYKEMLDTLRSSKLKKAVRWYNIYGNTKSLLDAIQLSNKLNIVNSVDKDHYIYKRGMEMRSSFLRHLDVIAARTPGQSMQSYMNMKAVAFSNSDTNVTYVCTMLNLLQGSDYDIDTVSLFTFDVNRNGMVLLWSPYSNLLSAELLRASEELPLPTGLVIANKPNYFISGKHSMDIFRKYPNLWKISRVNDGIETKIKISFNTESVNQIELLADFLKNSGTIVRPDDINTFLNEFNNFYKETYLTENDIIFDADDINDLYLQVASLINAHNTYLQDLSRWDRLKAYHNYFISNQIKIISDTANLSQSLQPTDYITEPLKLIADNTLIARKARFAGVGNVAGKVKSYTSALVGKEDVGITAVGSKIFSGSTEYVDWVLRFGSEKLKRQLLLYSRQKGAVKKVTGRILANSFLPNPADIDDIDVLRTLANGDNTIDHALTMAALISLAADNAKDPKLDKLNATTKTIGMYIYGTMQGMSFDSLAKTITSKTGLLYTLLMLNNVFSNDFAYYGASDIRNYFKYELDSRFLLRYNVYTSHGQSILNLFTSRFRDIFKDSGGLIHYWVMNADSGEPERPTNSKGEKLEVSKLRASLGSETIGRLIYLFATRKYKNIGNDDNVSQEVETLNDKLSILTKIRNNKSGIAVGSEQELYNLLLDFILEYVILLNEVNLEDLGKLIYLAEGAEESRVLGLLYSTNQRLYTKRLEFLLQLNNFELAVYGRKKITKRISLEELDASRERENSLLENEIMDIVRFAFDPDYAEEWIDKYEDVKHTINILATIHHAPQYKAYVESLAAAVKENSESFRFRTTRRLLNLLLLLKLRILNNDLLKGIDSFLNDYIRKQWLILTNRYIIMPKGNKYFPDDLTVARNYERTHVYNSGILISNADLAMQLGTDWGNANFKLFMEEKIIPELKELFPSNQFIQGLTPRSTNRTVSGNSIMVYSLDLNMSPRTPVEGDMLDYYKQQFNYLKGEEYVIRDENGNELQRIPVTDLFTYYTMIGHNWSLTEASLLPILEDIIPTDDLIGNFHDFEYLLDKSGQTLDLNEVWGTLLYYIANRGNLNSPGSDVVKVLNSNDLTIQYAHVQDTEWYDDYVTNRRSIYRNVYPFDYFPIGRDISQGDTWRYLYTPKDEETRNIAITYHFEGNTVENLRQNKVPATIYVNNTALSDLKEVKFVVEEGRVVPRLDLIEAAYKKQLNSCNI